MKEQGHRVAICIKQLSLMCLIVPLSCRHGTQGASYRPVASSKASVSSQQKAGAVVAKRRLAVEQGLLPVMAKEDQALSPQTITERMRLEKIPGLSIAVINNGRIEWSAGYGVLDRETKQHVTADTMFNAGSISKPVAALAIMRHVQRKTFALDQPVNTYLRRWSVPKTRFNRQHRVTLERLLSHSAGLPMGGVPGHYYDEQHPKTIVQILSHRGFGTKWRKNYPLVVPFVTPGTRWRYSGGGYCIIQQLAEDQLKRGLPEIIEKEVLEPLGMTRSTYHQLAPDKMATNSATGYQENGQAVPGRGKLFPCVAAAGLWTSAPDLAHFAIAVQQAIKGKSPLLSTQTARQMITPHEPSPSLFPGYGLAFVIENLGGKRRFAHHGSNPGFRALMVAYEDTGQGAVILTNSDRGWEVAEELLRSIARVYRWPGYPDSYLDRYTPQQVGKAQLKQWTGSYQLEDGTPVEIRLKDDTTLIFEIEGMGAHPLVAVGSNRFAFLFDGHRRDLQLSGKGRQRSFTVHVEDRILRGRTTNG